MIAFVRDGESVEAASHCFTKTEIDMETNGKRWTRGELTVWDRSRESARIERNLPSLYV